MYINFKLFFKTEFYFRNPHKRRAKCDLEITTYKRSCVREQRKKGEIERETEKKSLYVV